MSNWERKRDEMQRKIEVRSNVTVAICLLLMGATVFSCVKTCQKVSNKNFEQMYRLKQEMQKQK